MRIGASGFCCSGVLGLLDCSKKHASDFEEDHADTGVKLMDERLTKFCTPLGRVQGRRGPQPLACDEELKAHVLRTVTIFLLMARPRSGAQYFSLLVIRSQIC